MAVPPTAAPMRMPRARARERSEAYESVEPGRGPLTASPEPALGAFESQHHHERLQQDRQVQPQRAVPDVIQVVAQLRGGVVDRAAVLVTDLSPTGDAGADVVPRAVARDARGQQVDELGPLGARADQAH